MKSITKRFCAKVIGFVFFVSGILKLMDPTGTSLIIKDYMNFFHAGFMSGASYVIGEIVALTETFCGILLVTGIFRKVTAWITTAMMGLFTLLTLILWIFNPQMDCGCFGEAIHLTHFQSFMKNVLICVLMLVAFLPYRDFGTPSRKKYVTFGLTGIASIAFAVYSIIFNPMLELTPFNLSSRLAVAVEPIETMANDSIPAFIYEKNGKRGVFTLNKLPDSTWTFVEAQTIVKEDNIDESEYPELAFRDAEGNYRDSLAAQGNVIVISVTDPARVSERRWKRISETGASAVEAGFRFILIASSSMENLRNSISGSGISAGQSGFLMDNAYFADYRTLVSLNRSNGGATYFDDGNLIEKWSGASLPSLKDLKRRIRQDSTEVMLKSDSRGRLNFQAFMLYSISLLLLV
ncbi:MAG: DoxX family protein [Candidatus Cryptobacteroides sp.]